MDRKGEYCWGGPVTAAELALKNVIRTSDYGNDTPKEKIGIWGLKFWGQIFGGYVKNLVR